MEEVHEEDKEETFEKSEEGSRSQHKLLLSGENSERRIGT
jgi:hypothetical protein